MRLVCGGYHLLCSGKPCVAFPITSPEAPTARRTWNRLSTPTFTSRCLHVPLANRVIKHGHDILACEAGRPQ